jgi:hypothetical protein
VTVQLNACGGCGVLDQRIGEVCGTCGSGRFACGGQDTVICAGDLGDAALNACGGCGLLEAEPGAACGPCGEDFVECVGTDIVASIAKRRTAGVLLRLLPGGLSVVTAAWYDWRATGNTGKHAVAYFDVVAPMTDTSQTART